MLILKQNAANTVPTPPAGKGTIFLDDSDTLSVKTSDGNVENFPTVAASNSQVVFINGTALSGEAAFTYDFNNNILTVSGNIAAGNVKTDNLLYSNGVPWDLSDPGGSNTQIQFNDDESFGGSAAFTFNKSSNLVTVGANLDANNLNATTHITSGNVWANSGTVGASLLSGTLTTAAQPNITSVGTLTSVAVTGNVTAGNVYANSGTIGAQTLKGEGGNISNVTAGNITGQVANSLIAGTVYTNAQPNITSVGTLTSLAVTGNANAGNLNTGGNLSVSGNAIISGNLTVDGNLVYVNVESIAVEDPIIQLQTGPNGAAPSSNSGKDVGSALNYYDSQARIAFMGWDVSNAEFGLASQASITSEVVTFSTYGNLRAGVYFGDAGGLGNIPSANINGQVANALVAGTVYTNAQPNITSVGTLTSVAVTGNVTAGNVYANSGTIGASLLTGTLTTAAQPNITSTGTLTSLNVTGNITGGNLLGPHANGNSNVNIPAAAGNVNISVNGTANVLVVTETGANVAGTLNATGNANVNNLGTAQVLATANVTAPQLISNVSTGTAPLVVTSTTVVANLRAATSSVANTVNDAAQPNITSVGTLTSLTVTGNISAGNITGGALANGNSNVSIPAAAGNVNISSNGVANVVVVTSTGANIAGTLNATGNANVGNIGTAQVLATANVTAPQLISNVSTGTAPLVVSSTTKVTNLNADLLDGYNTAVSGTANTVVVRDADGSFAANIVTATLSGAATTAGTVTTAAQPNITSVGTLSSLAVTANVTAGNVYANSGTVGASLLTGTLTTAAQPNVTSLGTLTGLGVNGNITAANVTANTGVFTGNGSGLSQLAGGNVTGQVANALVAGTVYTAAQPNITSVGTLSSLAVTGNTTSGNFIGTFANGNSNVNIPAAAGNVNISSNGVANVVVVTSTGANIAGTLNATGNANVGNLGTAQVLASANVTTPVLISNVATGTAPLTVTSTTRVANLNAATSGVANTVNDAAQPNITSVGTLTSVAVTGNVTAGNVYANSGTIGASLLTGTLTTAAQPNITSVGTLTSLTVTGNATVGNLLGPHANGNSNVNIPAAAGNINLSVNGTANVLVVTATGANVTGTLNATGNANVGNLGTAQVLASANVTAPQLISNVATGTAPLVVTSTTVVANLRAATSNVANTVNDAAQPNITSVGTLTTLNVSGSAIITGNLTVDGNLVYVNTETLAVEDPIINLQTGPNGAAPTSNSGKDVGTALNYYDTQARIAFMGWDVSNTEFGLASVATLTNEVVTFTTYGNLRVGNIIGNGQALTGITGGNVTGQVANALVAGTVYTAAQPNITSVGTLSSLAVTGNVTAGNANVTGQLISTVATGTAPLVVTSTTQVANLSVATAGSATTAGTVTTAAQPNITSLGTLTSLGVNGTVTAVAFTANTGVFTGNANGLSSVQAGNLVGTTLSSTVVTSSLTTVGTLGSLTVTGNIGAGNVNAPTFGAHNGTIGATTANTGAFTTISATGQITSTLASGTAPFVVTSTTQVANLNVATSGTAGTVTTAAQPNITSVGTLSSLNVSGNITAPSHIANTGYLVGSVNAAVSAAGTVQGNATVLASMINVTSTVASGAGVALPSATAGMRVTIINTAANAVLVYPASGGTINSLSLNAAFSQAAGARLDFVATSTTQWYTLNATYA